MARNIGFFVFPRFQLLDLTGPYAAFHAASGLSPASGWRLHVISMHGGNVMSTASIPVPTVPANSVSLDTLVVAGGEGARHPDQPEALLSMVRELAGRCRRTASVCTGAFLLAAAGLLDGRRATTHWRHAAELQRAYRGVKVDDDRIFMKDGSIWTSAGIAAGIDLALALIEEDAGREVSRAVARELVVYHRRPGGQSQFSALLQMEAGTDRVREVMAFAREHLAEELRLERLAEAAHVSPRQFSRIFRMETGRTPARAVEILRVEAAKIRLDEGDEPVELIAAAVGFGDPERMRRAFVRHFGQPPQALRRAGAAEREHNDGEDPD
jgi:transcriptional regulator GlxA family with amidase domain